MVKAAASSWLAPDLSSDRWVRPVAALASRNRKVRNTRIGARPFLVDHGRPNRGEEREILCQIGERRGGGFLQEKTWVMKDAVATWRLKATLLASKLPCFCYPDELRCYRVPSLRSG